MGVQLAAARLPVRAPSLVAQHADALVLLLLGVPTAAIDWQIAVTCALPAWVAAAGVCLAAAPWGESFPSPALHHLVTWPGQFLLPLPLQAISRSVFGWWDERVFLLVAAVAIWLLLGALFPGIPGRMAAVAFFLVPGHSLLAVLGDNDLPVLALLLA